MRALFALAFLFALSSGAASANLCLDGEKLVEFDQQYENALLRRDLRFLEKLLADDFYWVHNLASAKENKADLLARLKSSEEPVKSRRSHDLTLRKLGSTLVIEGLSSVEKWNADGKTFRTSRYQFMRTYVAIKGECKLLAVQTMKVWSSGGE